MGLCLYIQIKTLKTDWNICKAYFITCITSVIQKSRYSNDGFFLFQLPKIANCSSEGWVGRPASQNWKSTSRNSGQSRRWPSKWILSLESQDVLLSSFTRILHQWYVTKFKKYRAQWAKFKIFVQKLSNIRMGSNKSGIQITITNMVFGWHLNKTLVWYSGGCYTCKEIGALVMNRTISFKMENAFTESDRLSGIDENVCILHGNIWNMVLGIDEKYETLSIHPPKLELDPLYLFSCNGS